MLIPTSYQVQSITHETHDVFTLALEKKDNKKGPVFYPGQFNMLYQFGIGEVPISISSHPNDNRVLEHTIRAVGSVTQSMQKLKAGDEIGLRGPFGSYWPLKQKDCDVLVIAGGIGFAALRAAMYSLADRSHEYKKITLLYGTRTIDDIFYQKDMEEWKKQGIEIEVTLDYADIHWKGRVGVVTSLIHQHLPNPGNTLVLICGPEIMIKFAIHALLSKPIDENNIYVSMERNMQCALGFCGHCQYGPYFLCKDGPVFSYPQIKKFLNIKEL